MDRKRVGHNFGHKCLPSQWRMVPFTKRLYELSEPNPRTPMRVPEYSPQFKRRSRNLQRLSILEIINSLATGA
jgi:hypothetical protein